MVRAKFWNECKVQGNQARKQDTVFAYRQKVFEILVLSFFACLVDGAKRTQTTD